jgi:hypothetical protein
VFLSHLKTSSQIWWYLSIIPALRKPKQRNLKFKASLGYLASSRPLGYIAYLKNKQEVKE